MSGIYGRVGDGAAQALERMSQALEHRGPDGSGLFSGDGVALGCRLLRTEGPEEPAQPAADASGRILAVLDGAIYNRRDLRAWLGERGRAVCGAGDADLLVALYEEDPAGFPGRIRGHFALAIWDGRTRRLVLARDHLGQKPLYWARSGGALYFASEIKALTGVLDSALEVDLEALDRYLSLRFVPGERTMLRGIHKVRPAHVLVHDGAGMSQSRFWKLSFAHKLRLSEDELIEGLEHKLHETVACHLAGAGTGAFLSGGLDSSLIVAMMAREMREPVPTFSIGFAEKDFDEMPHARLVARTFGTRQIEAQAEPDLVRDLPAIIHGLDEPSDPVAASFFAASRLAAAHVKVALGGDGGNELMAGSDRYRGVLLAGRWAMLPRPLRRALVGPLVAALPASFGYTSFKMKLAWLERMAGRDDLGERLAEAVAFFRFSEEEKDSLLQPGVRRRMERGAAAAEIAERYAEADAEQPIERMVYTDYCTRLPEHLLMLVDRMGMVHGLEVRSPLVDRDLVEYLASFPLSMKVRGGQARYVWYALARRLLPESIARRAKRGFRFPLALWFATTLQPFLRGVLGESALVADGYLDGRYLERLLDEHRDRAADHSWKIWMLLNLETWYRMTVRGAGRERTESWIQGGAQLGDDRKLNPSSA